MNLSTPPRIRLHLLAPSIALIVAATMIPTGLRHPSLTYIDSRFGLSDFLNNVILYLPLGIALSNSSLLRTLLVGFSLATGAEALQLSYVDRIPSFFDIASNTSGAVAGYLVVKLFFAARREGASVLTLPRPLAAAAIPIALLGTVALLHNRPAADFSNWNPAYHLATGNELTGQRAWSGTISSLSIYSFAMSPSQIEQLARTAAGNPSAEGSSLPAPSEAPVLGPIQPANATAGLAQRLLSDPQERSLYDALVARNQLTLLVWMRTDNLGQSGAARIVTYSQDFWNRNFTLGQIQNTLTFRLRTPASGWNGTDPALYTGPVLSRNHASFVAAVYDGRVSTLYVDGKSVAHADIAARRPRLPKLIFRFLPGSLPIRVIELSGAEILLSGLFSIGIFACWGIPRVPSRRYWVGAAAGAAIATIICSFAVSQQALAVRILVECIASGLLVSASLVPEPAAVAGE